VVVNTDKTNVSEKGLNTDKNPVTEKSTTEKTSAIDKVTNTEKASSDNSSSTEPTIYRVQLGAYQHKLSSTHIFTSVNNLIEVKTENGFYTYSAGSFTNYKEAAVYRTQLVTEGFSDAFIKAYRHGKRVALASAGATFIKPEKENLSDSVTKEQNTMDRSEITFKVQLGVFKGSPPGLMREKFKKIKGLAFEEDEHSETHYFVGPYQDYETAEKMKEKVIKEGIQGAFVVAYFKDKQIPLQQAISIMKK
jgi:cell division protein FtsN